jgi:electron transport complex protein RnfB
MPDGLEDRAGMYGRLAEALDRLPNGFPSTPSGVEILLLKRIFSPHQASLASQLGGSMEEVDIISERLGLAAKDVGTELMKMARRGLVWFERQGGTPRFRLAPFVVGIYEAQLDNMDHELAHLAERYLADGGAAGIMKPHPALHRVVPAQRALKAEWILPYDDVRGILLAAKTFQARDCICRAQQDLVGRQCDFPLRTCLTFSTIERPSGPDDMSREEALTLLDQVETIGLVHTVSNVMKGIGYVCNCCGCCCGILRGITEWGIESSVAHANYYAEIEPGECVECGTCIERCQVHAISEQDGAVVVDRDSCIGCGLCVTGCASGAAKLQRNPEADMVDPPVDYRTWEHQRLVARGLAEY